MGYGLGVNLQWILERYWNNQTVVPWAGRYYCRPFKMERGVNQGDPVYPIIFKRVVDAVVRATLMEVCTPQESHHGLGWE